MNIFPIPLHERYLPQNVNHAHQKSLGVNERIAVSMTSAIGTMFAVYLIAVFIGGWMLWEGKISHHPFDPYPFAFLLFV